MLPTGSDFLNRSQGVQDLTLGAITDVGYLNLSCVWFPLYLKQTTRLNVHASHPRSSLCR